jgi:hypothetical protein
MGRNEIAKSIYKIGHRVSQSPQESPRSRSLTEAQSEFWKVTESPTIAACIPKKPQKTNFFL